MKTVIIYDTTLRDGSQGEGINYSIQDKVRIVQKLDDFGIPYIEGGWPSNPKDAIFFAKMARAKMKNSSIVAFGSTRRPGISVSNDRNLQDLLLSRAGTATIFGKSSLLHVREILKTTPEENINMINESIAFLIKNNFRVFYDAEHFFDGYKLDPAYALQTLLVAQNAGASYIILCDTNGGALPDDISRIIKSIKPKLKAPIGIHCHNDAGLAIANSLTAVAAGATMVQGTINGYGERCGNADLIPIIANLKLKMNINCIPEKSLPRLTEISYFVSEVSNMRHMPNQPYTGDSAFAHKGGVHINAIMKTTSSYEHINPELVGNKRRVIVSELGGKSSVITLAKSMNLDLTKNDPKTKRAHELIQKMEGRGYHFEAAEASLELLLRKALSSVNEYFKLDSFRVIVNKNGRKNVSTEAIIKIKIKGQLEHTAADGDGPVNALDNALRKALSRYYPQLNNMKLSDFKVRVLDEKAGTAAPVRVLIQSQDEHDTWNTMGVSENIIEASWQALIDSFEYKLMKDKIR